MWIIVRKADHRVIGIQDCVQPEGAWNHDVYEVKEWFGAPPCIHIEDEPPRPCSLDPTLSNPWWSELAAARIDFDALADEADAEIDWLDDAIARIPTADLEELRVILLRVTSENRKCIKSWRYLFRRLSFR